ncbi:MAG: ATP-binding cassette domain-containing protein [Desulfuromonadaceae bacterium]|nr:ATP-binding cassette domain-containing protein [Desulfuromonas sp.]MDY0185717.1 ATP-binding cassette domain-containing protein [Desulfuromonadaceae bacterium]
MKQADLFTTPLNQLCARMPELIDFFASFGLEVARNEADIDALLASLSATQTEHLGMTPTQFRIALQDYVAGVEALDMGQDRVHSIRILPGRDKSGHAEEFELELVPGQIVSIVGPTGSGKSRLLADIEWVAQGDTPTGRRILLNNAQPDAKWRFSTRHKLVAQLSQNMNFVMDLTVEEFIRVHGESRFVPELEQKIKQVLDLANSLAGEPFAATTQITALSGGQSRALMIADIAILSQSPVVLIDEIENAGIERKKALELLVQKEKIVLIATHDPILALLGEKRLVISNGGIKKVITTSAAERANLVELERMDRVLMQLRQRIRNGETLEQL